MPGKRQLIHNLQHFLTGAVLILKGIDKFPHHHFIGGLIFSFGLIILIYFVFAALRKVHSPAMHIMIHLFETVVYLFTAYIFYSEGSKYLHFVFLLASIGFFISAIVAYKKRKH
jgi:hypothetical protein